MHSSTDEIHQAGLDQPPDKYEETADRDDDIISKTGNTLLDRKYTRQDKRDHKDDADDIDRNLFGGKQHDRQHEQKESENDR